jgi:hypothetical protein
MQRHLVRRRDGLKNDLPRQLMAEGERLSLHQQHADGQTLVGGGSLRAGDLSQYPRLAAWPDDSGGLHNGLGGEG